METKANYVIVGIFTIVTLCAAMFIVFLISRNGESNNMLPLEIRIPGSVTGLSEGSAVLFNGIRVGTVRKLILDKTNPNLVIARTEVNNSTPITRSTQATLGFQGLTGIAFIELKGGSLHEKNLLQSAIGMGAVARIDADPSTLNNLMATAQDIFARMSTAIDNLEGFVRDARSPLTHTVQDMQKFSETLAKNRDKFDHIVDDAQVMMARLRTASDNINPLMSKLDALFSPSNKDGVVGQAQETLTSIRHAADAINANLRPISRSMQSLLTETQRAIRRVDRAVSDFERDPQRLIFGGSGTVPQYDGRKRR